MSVNLYDAANNRIIPIAGNASGGGVESSSVLYYVTNDEYYAGMTVKATGLINGKIYTTTLDEDGNGYSTVDGMERYTIELITEEGGIEETIYTSYINAAIGWFYYLQVGYSKNTWSGIQGILDAHMENEFLEVGDEIKTKIGGVEYIFQVGGIDLYDSHEVIFVPKVCIGQMAHHTSATNSGGWASSDVRTYLNGDFYNSLEDSLKEHIKPIEFKTIPGEQSTTITTTEDKIWIPREYEIFGETAASGQSLEVEYCHQYPIFNSADKRIRMYEGTAVNWLSATTARYPDPTASKSYWQIVSNTGTHTQAGGNTTAGLVPCFRLVAD